LAVLGRYALLRLSLALATALAVGERLHWRHMLDWLFRCRLVSGGLGYVDVVLVLLGVVDFVLLLLVILVSC
jgi:hypothetical protein